MFDVPFLNSLMTLATRQTPTPKSEEASRPFHPMTVAYKMGDDPGPKQTPRSFYIDDPGVRC